jgi:hypothetical protein
MVTGWSLAHQSFTATVPTPARNTNLFFFGAEGGVETHLWHGLYLHLRGAALAYVFPALQADGSSRTSTTATYQFAAGLGWQIR